MNHKHGQEVPTTEEQKLALEKLHEQVATAQAAFIEASALLKNARTNFWENAAAMGLVDGDWQYIWEPREREMLCLGLSGEGVRKVREEAGK